MRTLEAVCYGALGGMCPTLAKLAGSFSTNPNQDMPALGVYIGVGLFAILGGIVALGFGTREVKAAIVAGIAAPAIVTNVISGVSDNSPQNEQAALYELVGSAHAQSGVIELAQASGSVITVNPMVSGGDAGQIEPLYYWWKKDDGTRVGRGEGVLNPTSEQSLAVPSGATLLVINGRTIDLSGIAQSGGKVDLTVTAKPTLGGDLRWALGGQRQLTVQDLQAQIIEQN